MKFRWEVRRFGLAALLMSAAGINSVAAEESAYVRSFYAPDGETYYSLSLKSDDLPAAAATHDHVLLVDTSASQIGEYRSQTLAVVDSLLASLPATDRVSVVAVDLNSSQLTDGFVAPATARSVALPTLRKRFPAGATNLLTALKQAQTQLQAERPSSLIYIGDGMSTAHILDSTEMQAVVTELRGRQVPVHTLAIGPNKDVRLMGVLSSLTGGSLRIDDWRDDASLSAQQVGADLARAVNQPVWYPAKIETTAEVLPKQPLPIRGDRTTVWLSRGEIAGKEIVLTSATGERKSFRLEKAESEHGNTYLYGLWGTAEQTPELGTGIAGETVLAFAQTSFEDQVSALELAGYEALRQKDLSRAEEIGLAIRSVDPQNVRATGLINAQELALLDDVAPQANPAVEANPAVGDNPAVGNEPAVGTDPVAPAVLEPTPAVAPAVSPLDVRTAPAADQGLIDLAQARQEALAQKLSGELDKSKAAAQQVLRSNPAAALDILERMRNTLKSATDISPDARENMLRDLNNFTQQVRVTAAQQEQQLRAEQLKDRINDAQALLIERAKLDDEKMEQLVDRVRALMIEFYAGDDEAAEAAEMVSNLIINLRPGNPLGIAALTTTEAAGQLRKANRLRALRADRYLETLYQVELSHVPFPDEPPVRYPPAEVWQALTVRRKKWNSVDLKKNNPNEERIYSALDDKVDMEFIDTELSQVLQFLADRYQIPIIPDSTRMTDFGVGLDTPVNLVISGISLKSGLKLLLEPLELTYIIEDEVMKVTTSEYANQLLQTRVYPVADLVIPIQPLFGSGFGAGGLGQQGGLGGGQGGQGGQGGGFGGGGGGGGGLGINVGGGGLFSVPVEDLPTTSVNSLKKKP